jgi:hypothetical protein
MGFLRKPSTISCTHKTGVKMVMDPRRWVEPKLAKTPQPVPKRGYGSSHNKTIPNEMLPITRPPLAHVQPSPLDVKQLNVQPVPCDIMNDAINSFSNVEFIEDIRNPPFVSSSATLEYSTPLPPIQVQYVDPPLQFADPASASASASAPAVDDMNLYSFSSPSPEALTIDFKAKISRPRADKGKRPFRRARFPRKVFKNSNAPLLPKYHEPLNTPPPMSPEASPSKTYSQYHLNTSDSESE